MDTKKNLLTNAKRIVIKIGTQVLTSKDGTLNKRRITNLVNQINLLKKNDSKKQVVLVSSGAIGAAMGKLSLSQRPTSLPEIQALAAIGQSILIETYRKSFNRHEMETGQILLTKEDFHNRQRYLNIANTLLSLLSLGIVPIINENDSVATDAITFGDNDQLCAEVAQTLHADLTIILTNADGLLDFSNGKMVVPIVKKIDQSILKLIEETKSSLGAGGMHSKLKAIKKLTDTGEAVILGNGLNTKLFAQWLNGEDDGTLFLPQKTKLKRRKKWIGYSGKPSGALHVDQGAMEAITQRNKSLLPIGINKISGQFDKGGICKIIFKNKEIARGLVNFSSTDLSKIKGRQSSEIKFILKESFYREVIHKDNLVNIHHEN